MELLPTPTGRVDRNSFFLELDGEVGLAMTENCTLTTSYTPNDAACMHHQFNFLKARSKLEFSNPTTSTVLRRMDNAVKTVFVEVSSTPSSNQKEAKIRRGRRASSELIYFFLDLHSTSFVVVLMVALCYSKVIVLFIQ